MKVTSELAELLGIMYGDGCLSNSGSKHLVYISGHKDDDFEYHNKIIRKLFFKVFNKEVNICMRNDENTLFIRFSDENIFNIFKSLGMPIGLKLDKLHLPEDIKNDRELMCHFIRGITDTDGCIIFSKQHRDKPYYLRIEITNKSENFLKEILEFLKNNGFYGSVSNKGVGYRLEVPGLQNLNKWLKYINFRNVKHIKKIEAQLGPLTPRTRILPVNNNSLVSNW